MKEKIKEEDIKKDCLMYVEEKRNCNGLNKLECKNCVPTKLIKMRDIIPLVSYDIKNGKLTQIINNNNKELTDKINQVIDYLKEESINVKDRI